MRVNRIVLFLIGCVTIRTGIVALAWYVGPQWWVALLALIAAISFFLSQYGKRDTPGLFGSRRYWNNYIHAFLYLVFAILTSLKFEWAWSILLVDVVVSIFVVAKHYIDKV